MGEEARRRKAAGGGGTPTPQDGLGGWRDVPRADEIKQWFFGSLDRSGGYAPPPRGYSLGEERDRQLGPHHRTVVTILGEMFADLQHGCTWDFDPVLGSVKWSVDGGSGMPDEERWFHDSLPVLIRLTPASFEAAVRSHVEVLQQQLEDWSQNDRLQVVASLHEWQATIMRLISHVSSVPVQDDEGLEAGEP